MTVTPDLDKSRTSRPGHGRRSPTAATLLWLEEAHASGPLPAYVAWLVDQPASAAPLYRVPEAAEAGVRAALRGEKRDALERAVREAAGQAVLLVELVIGLNTAVEEAIRLEGLRYAALFWEMQAISAEAQLESASPSRKLTARWSAWRAAVANLIGSLYLAEKPERTWSAATSRAPRPSLLRHDDRLPRTHRDPGGEPGSRGLANGWPNTTVPTA